MDIPDVLSHKSTHEVAERWFDALSKGDIDIAFGLLDDDVEFVNYTPVPGFNADMPWIGTYRGRQAVRDSFRVFTANCEVESESLEQLIVDGSEAVGVVHETSKARNSGQRFEIVFIQQLTVRDGRIVRWKSYTDPSSIIRALRGGASADPGERLTGAAWSADTALAAELIKSGADVNRRDPATGLTPLMIAAGTACPEMVRLLIGAGADVFTTDSRAGATALHKACQGGSLPVVAALVEAGAFVDAVAASTGHTPLMDALWFKHPEIARYLLDHDASLNVSTRYGTSLKEHFDRELNVSTVGKDRMLLAEQYLKERQAADESRIAAQHLMAAVIRGDAEAVRQLLVEGAEVDERFPVVNGPNDAHTPLLVAARDGHAEIAGLLLTAGADVNATEPVFGAAPLHKAVRNGRTDLTRLIATWPGVDLDFQGATNGYTPLHEAVWHGYDDCAHVLLDAGAAVDRVGHDGKKPVDLAAEVFGDHPLTRRIAAMSRL